MQNYNTSLGNALLLVLSTVSDFVVHVHQKRTDTNTEFHPTQCTLLTWYSPKGPINRPRMDQDVMLCGSPLYQILPDIHTTLYLNAVSKGKEKRSVGTGETEHLFYKKLTENLRL